MDIGPEDKPFIAEPVEDPFQREVPVPDTASDPLPVEVPEEPLIPA